MSAAAADVRAQVDALRQDRIDGKVDQPTFLARMDELGPKLAETPAPAPPTQLEARAKLEQLRFDRVLGKVGDEEFHRQMAQLAPLANGETPPAEAPSDPAAQVMEGATPDEYGPLHDPMHPLVDDDAREFDTQARQALSALKIPARLGPTLAEQVNRRAGELVALSPEEREVKIESTRAELRRLWGDKFKANADVIDEYVYNAAATDPLVAAIYDHSPWLLLDTWVAETLLQVAQYQATRK